MAGLITMRKLGLGLLSATIVRLEAFDAQQVRGQSGTITAVVNALAKAGIELGENGSIFPRPEVLRPRRWEPRTGPEAPGGISDYRPTPKRRQRRALARSLWIRLWNNSLNYPQSLENWDAARIGLRVPQSLP